MNSGIHTTDESIQSSQS